MLDRNDKMNPVTRLKVRLDDGSEMRFRGREAWTMHLLNERGEVGISSLDYIGPRLSQYVFNCRGKGIVIETVDQPHGGAFPGGHGKYVLRTPMKVLEVKRFHKEGGNA